MNYFRYKLIEHSGEVLSGVIKLPYEEVISAVSHLERDGGYTIHVRKPGRLGQFFCRLTDRTKNRTLKRPMQAELLNNISLMLRAGLPLTGALEEVAEGDDMKPVADSLRDINNAIRGGTAFSSSAARHPHIFPKSVVHLIRMGEDTGRLDKMLEDAAEHVSRIHQILSDTKQALIYPAFVMVAMGGGLLFWFAFVVPKIISLFQEMEVDLPVITRILIHVSDFVQAYALQVMLGIAAAAVLAVTAYRSNSRWKKAVDGLSLKLPVVGTIVSASTLAYITEYFSILINAGIDILQSLTILQSSVSNAIYREKLSVIREAIQKGDGIADGFKKARFFPSFVIRMVSIGERSGSLSDQLVHIAGEYRRKLALLVATIGKMIEPAVLIAAGIIFAIIVLGLFLPIYDLVSQVGSM